MDTNEKLQQAGLTGNESKVYLELVQKEGLSASQIAKNIGMDRTLTYTILNHLIEKGQINYVIKENKKVFSCSDTKNLLNQIKAKEAMVLDLIKDLGKIKSKKQEETRIEVYEGKEGIRTLMKEIVKTRHFVSFGGTGRAYDLLYEIPAITKKAEKTKASARVIMNQEYRKHEITKYKNIKVRFSDIKSEATTTIFGDCVSIHLIKNKPIVILIKNKDITNSYRNYFEVLWKNARE